MEETAGSSVWATLITAREKTLARDRRGVVGDQGVLVTAGLRGLLGPLGTGDVGSGSGDRRAWGGAGGTGPPGVLGGVCGNAGDAVSQEGAVETSGQVCTEPAERGASGAAPDPHKPPPPPCPGSSEPCTGEGRAKVRRLHRLRPAAPVGQMCLALPGLVPAGEPSSVGRSSRAGAAGGSAGLARSFSDGELLSNGRTGDCTERLGLVQPRSAAQG